ncbi:NAD(P)H-dependent oxidoreductase [Vagococcus carniphilus]|uniref:NAD(P)H-dependent oxidoreductase n=1 Tax=Vagococcus carniphilus TaxID=218144 RepID=UPI0028927390|nr:NAD(P)H-dependent oxidoreductase [Vagococcus carniphilus]MDT2863758.1 NAD(P)H-dependent oxidoreductase [Vagococcus carniphilus]
MKKTLVIIAHPEVGDSQLQQFLLESGQSLKEVEIHYLIEDQFDIKEEQNKLKKFDRIIFQFPMYWYSAPFILKKWIDEVIDYTFSKTELRHKELGLVVSLGVDEANFASGKPEKFTLSEIFRPFEALANKCQMIFLPIFSISLFSYMTEIEKKRLLIEYQQYLTKKNNVNFETKENWFVSRGKSISKTYEGTEQEDLEQIMSIIEDNREEIEELRLLIDEMRSDEP